jgi:hypothetical protein
MHTAEMNLRRSDSHWVYRVVFTLDELRLSHDTVNRTVEPMVILRRQPEDSESSLFKPFGILGVSITQQSCNSKFATLDPDTGCIINFVEGDTTTVRRRYNHLGVVWRRAWPCTGLQLSVEEFVEPGRFC